MDMLDLRPSITPETDAKLREMIIYFLDKGGRDLGKTKLMKLLYYSDFGRVREHGEPISGTPYEKWPQGPVPPRALDLLHGMIETGEVALESQDFGSVVRQCHLLQVGLEEALGKRTLSATEYKTLDSVWARWKDASTTKIVNASHEETPWLVTSLWETIPYHTALFD